MNKPANNSANGKNNALLNVVNLNEEQEQKTEVVEVELKIYPEDEISPGKLVTLNFSLSPADNPTAFIDSNFDKSPVSFVFGDGNLLAGFEEVIIGLKAGDKKTFSVDAEKAFGLKNEDNVHLYPRYQFPADLVLDKGLMINFTDAGGNEQAGIITDFNADEVFVDFNHPLAGINILFAVDIKTVELI